MSSLEPLLRGGGTDFERELLSAVRGERPSARQRRRMLRGLGLSSGIALWAATAHAVVTGATGKLVLGLGAAAIVTFGALPLVRERAAARNAGATSAAAASASAASAAASPAPTVFAAPIASAAPPAEAIVERATDGDESATDSAEAADGASELRAQIDLLDTVKAAVNRKDGAEALALLARFDERFPSGALSSEARTLRRAAGRLPSDARR